MYRSTRIRVLLLGLDFRDLGQDLGFSNKSAVHAHNSFDFGNNFQKNTSGEIITIINFHSSII